MVARCILSVPVLTKEECNSMEQLDIQCPRGVLQLINKAKNKRFVEEDVISVQLWSNIIGRSHKIIKQLEEFNSLKSNFNLINEATNRVMFSLDQNASHMNQVLQNFLSLNTTINNQISQRDTRFLNEDN
mmetsp:Transcript_25849/g.25121  ORF Transcript_25849/g.25121 Transcript_25849/m.25121 type:complete len:130 (+) Transcript_25849:1925-2314(+)